MSEPEGRAFRPKDIAIIGMSGRFPGARDINEFWRNQLNGVEAIRRFDAEPGNRSNGDGSSEGTTLVGARAVLDQADQFDADFFGMHPREAALTDPQHRIFLECCWEAFEDAGYEPGEESEVGVFAGCAMPTYFLSTLGTLPGFLESFTRGYQVENYAEMLGNSLDFLATRVSYKLDLRGPSFTLQAGCSTSLLAVCQACDALRNHHCELALAGGISITFPQMRAARYQDGGMISADGHCRAFDAAANGTVFGCGAGVVLLKRLGEAMRDGDHVYGVIRGYAVNNDGSAKAGYTAPSVEGQARVIAAAHRDAEVGGNEIGYIEAHGTGTPLGDPIELTALNQVFRGAAAAKNSCAIGTAKTNVGHLDVAAGITGLIHAVQILRHAEFPPTLHFRSSNGHFGMEESPFYVNQQRKTWPRQRSPRRAGVSSFGIGGTNAHVILEEKPIQEAEPARKTAYLLTVSARSEGALQQASADLASFLGTHAETNLADAAYTLHCGRKAFAFRRAVSVKDASEVMQALTAPGNLRGNATAIASEEPRVVFLFPGQGSQERGMASDIYENEKGFREPFDRCAEILKDPLRADLREIVFNKSCAHDFDLDRTEFAQPAIFAVEYALAQLWESWGIRPSAMLGHSIGEYVAATLAGVMTLEDALALVAARGKLMQEVAPGAMLAVRASEASLTEMLSPSVSLAAVNSSRSCVVSGSIEAIEGFESQLQEQGVATRRLKTSHAFHSAMMDSVLERFTERARAVRTKPAAIPYVSCLTGNWITEDDLRNPNYWANHLRGTVRFASGLRLVTRDAQNLLLEVGPGKSLAALVREEVRGGSRTSRVVSSVPDISAGSDSYRGLLEALGWLWTAGADVDWRAFHGDERRLRVSLPTYPFERKRFWLDSPTTKNSALDGNHTEQGSIPVSTSPNTPSLPESSRPRTDERIERLRSDVMAILTNLSGAALSTAESSTTFLELGFDSLFLAQVSIALQKQFGVKVTFRQLLNDFSSAERLAAHLDGVLPRDVSKGEKPAAREDGPLQATPNREQALPGSDAPVDSQPTRSPLQTLMQEQLRAMNELFAKQLEAMEKSGEDGNPRTALRQKSADVAQPTPACAPSAASAPEASRRKQEAVEKAFTPHHPPATKHSGEWSNSQRAYLSELIERYTKRTARSKALTQQYRRVLADPRVVSGFRPEWKEMVYPIVTIRSEGSHLWDVDGNEYIDLLNGFGPIFFGHRPESIERAVAEQLHQGFEIGPQSQLAGEVAALFCELTGNERMTFCNTGSEAVMAALRVSRTVTGRSKVVVFAGAYHGMFDEVLITRASGGSSVGALPIAPGIPQENLSNMVVLEYGSASALDWIRQHASELAAVLVEPVQSRHPALQPVEFLKELRGLTAASGTALIFDEVVTGFRVHPGGCQALFGIRADLATYGKVLAGGLPIGVLAGRAEFMNALDGGPWQFGDDSYPEANVTFFAGTFVRHPLALAAAKATLGQLKSAGPKLQEDLARRTTRLAAALRATFEQQLIPAQIEDFTSLFYMQFPREFPYGSLLYYALREKGIYILEGFPSFLTTAHSGQDVARIEESFSQAAEEMHAAGFYSKGEAPSPRLVMGSERSTEPQTVEVALTEAQMEILLAAQMSDAASCAFNESFTIRLCGTLDRSAFETALGELFARHDALRASISTEAQMLRFAKQVELPLRFQNLSGLSRSDADAAIADAVRSDALLPFDLAKPPLVRMTLFQLSATEHALLFTAHHVVCDGWSSNVLLSELATLYSAQISGDASKLSPALQFSEYALRQAATRAKTEDREFWMAQFRDLAPVLELPTDRSRPVVKSFAGATARSDIERTLLERIKRASTSQGCTLFAALLTAFGALLHRLTSQDDIAIGIPFAGQSSLAESNLVGHCVNFLPIRMRWFEADTAADALQRVQRSLLDAQEHQDFTYGTLVRERNVPRQPGRLPLIEVQFNLEKIGGGLSFQGLQAEIETNPKAAVNFDLFLNAVETKNGLRLECDYNSDLFDERTIERWLSHYAVLLEGMASNQNQPISAQPLLTEAQRKQLISEWNATERDFPLDLRVYELFQTQAARTPEKIAVSGKGGALTYQQLEERSNQLARHLLKIGLQPNDLIGVALDRSINMFVTLLAVWKAGVAYVPLDPAYPQERIAFILDDASVPILITTSDLIERLPVCDARLVCLDRDSILIEREAASSPDPVANTQPLAYVIYTSGSTGRPKGVAVTQRNLVNLLLAMQLEPGITPEDRLLAVTTLSFDIAALELFLPIVSGAQVVLAARDDAADGRALRRLMQNENITMLQATPATWRLLLEAGWPEEHRLKMLCGGEALSRDLADALLPHGELWNMYGPTETTVWSAVSRVTRGTGSIPLGHPIANTQFYVLDSHQQLLPLGVAGELCIGGEGVAQGYFHRPDLTEKVFLPDPFHPNGQHRIYRTGDTVRCHADGTLEFLGRSDQQVKIRGFRVELQEVEAALNRHPGIRQAVAAGCNDEHGFKKLVAYVVPERPPEAPDPSELREWLRGHLPTYMIPSQYIFLDALPHTPNGKVDRKSLPHPEDAARLTDEFVSPRTPLEAQIASLCATVMQVDRIGVTTSLLDLGADSLHLFQIASRAAAAGLPVTAEQIMRLHTVEALAKEIGRTKESDSSFGALPPLAPLAPLAPAAREQFRVASAD